MVCVCLWEGGWPIVMSSGAFPFGQDHLCRESVNQGCELDELGSGSDYREYHVTPERYLETFRYSCIIDSLPSSRNPRFPSFPHPVIQHFPFRMVHLDVMSGICELTGTMS